MNTLIFRTAAPLIVIVMLVFSVFVLLRGHQDPGGGFIGGLIAAFEDIKPTVPFVVRLDGTNDVEGRRLLAEAALPNVHTASTMNEAAEKVVALAGAGQNGASA